MDALRTGYYLIVKVSAIDIQYNKQHAFATAYWNPDEPSFGSCLATKIKLTSLGNRLSEGPKELSLKELENQIIQVVSNDLVESQVSGYNPTYKIVWKLLGKYSGLIMPTFFLTPEIENKWALCNSIKEDALDELAYSDQLSEDEEQALSIYLMEKDIYDEEAAISYEIYTQEQYDLDNLPDEDDDYENFDDIEE